MRVKWWTMHRCYCRAQLMTIIRRWWKYIFLVILVGTYATFTLEAQAPAFMFSLSPSIKMHILLTVLHIFLIGISWKNLIKR